MRLIAAAIIVLAGALVLSAAVVAYAIVQAAGGTPQTTLPGICGILLIALGGSAIAQAWRADEAVRATPSELPPT